MLCFGARRGRQHTFALFDDWVPPTPALPREEALAKLALRYFRSHGPASVRDFAWWAGLTLAEAGSGLDSAQAELASEPHDGVTFWSAAVRRVAARAPGGSAVLLPPFDELLVAYTDRTAAVDPKHVKELHALLSPTVARGGRIIGTWGRKEKKGRVLIACRFFARPTAEVSEAVEAAARRYGEFVSMEAALTP